MGEIGEYDKGREYDEGGRRGECTLNPSQQAPHRKEDRNRSRAPALYKIK